MYGVSGLVLLFGRPVAAVANTTTTVATVATIATKATTAAIATLKRSNAKPSNALLARVAMTAKPTAAWRDVWTARPIASRGRKAYGNPTTMLSRITGGTWLLRVHNRLISAAWCGHGCVRLQRPIKSHFRRKSWCRHFP